MNYGNQQQTAASQSAVMGFSDKGSVIGGYERVPAPVSALAEASDRLDNAITEAMSLAEVLAERISPILRPVAAGVGPNGDNKVNPACSLVVETMNRQRGRIQAVSAQLQDLLSRVEL